MSDLKNINNNKCCEDGWWCLGCGSNLRRKLLKKHITDTNLIKDIMNAKSECGDPLVPCFICNKSGDKKLKPYNVNFIENFWKDFH